MKEINWASEINGTIEKLRKNNLIATGDISDSHHTFDELYEHRCKLFSLICNSYVSRAWKSKKHDDGTMFPNMFIVGIKTPEGMYTYHYDLKYWDLFNVEEIERGYKWDGHTAEDIDRLFSLLMF